MLLTVAAFKQRVREDMDGLVADLQEVTGREGKEEADAWRSSLPATADLLSALPATADLLSAPELDPLHVFFGGAGHTSLEYQLPAASAWCDLILLGSKNGRPAALIMELKHWATATDQPGPTEGLMLRYGSTYLHPSKQVRGYTEYIRNFHSAVHDQDATVNGCVFFTRSGAADAYLVAPNDRLTTNHPIFTTAANDVSSRFPAFAAGLITDPAPEFAERFERGRYVQNRGFVSQIGQQILDPSSSPFVLLDNQEKAFLICRDRLRELVHHRDGTGNKRVVIVHGPPGSGKSVVAAKLWASLVTDGTLQVGNVVLTTTSASQNSNWVHLVERAGRTSAAAGIVKKAAGYHPVSTQTVGKLRKKHGAGLFQDAVTWRANLQLLRQLHPLQAGAEDDAFLVSLVDEAHALINPEHSDGRGQFGFAPTLGPQAYHIIRTSKVAVFFMDRDQGYRDRENTTVADIRLWAQELGASIDEVDLSGAQFRCAGSKEYTDWIETIRSDTHPHFAAKAAKRWRGQLQDFVVRDTHGAIGEARPQPYLARPTMAFEIVESPFGLDAFLLPHKESGASVRLLSSYSRKWNTAKAPQPHELPAELQDFAIESTLQGQPAIWKKPWNYVPAQTGDYTLFVQAKEGSRMARDPLSEVGCPYAVRGFDFDYIGLIWGKDLVWRTSRWIVQPRFVFETGVSRAKKLATKEADLHGPAHRALLNRVWQSYRILLTRPMRGLVVYVEDEETRQYLLKATGRT
ncbi:DNA/RNA helicase domain-containing protein [Hydrocarboniphaga sp.]|uniref:DNA/RNA helicase domain-containing protein n=1 Tax=Hydrocarboniphaga sp. TaxID=2033016 RepID=UPI003D0D1930